MTRAPYRFTKAICRTPSQSVTRGLRAHGGAGPDYKSVADEHARYVTALEAAGVETFVLPALEAFPDSVFVEDPALVFPEAAILLRPGAASRFGETAAIAPDLRAKFETVLSVEDGSVDGGDVLNAGGKVMIGLSARTDMTGARALIRLLEEIGRKGDIVATPPGVLHFKSDCGLIDEETVLSTPRLAAGGFFDGFDVVETATGEEGAANVLRVNDDLFLAADHPRTAASLARRGARIVELSTAAISKIDAGLSCMSLRW